MKPSQQPFVGHQQAASVTNQKSSRIDQFTSSLTQQPTKENADPFHQQKHTKVKPERTIQQQQRSVDQQRKTNGKANSPLYSIDPNKAVNKWQSSLDRQIERQRITADPTSMPKTTKNINSSSSNAPSSYIQQSSGHQQLKQPNLRNQKFPSHGGQQTMSSKKLPLAELLQLEPVTRFNTFSDVRNGGFLAQQQEIVNRNQVVVNSDNNRSSLNQKPSEKVDLKVQHRSIAQVVNESRNFHKSVKPSDFDSVIKPEEMHRVALFKTTEHHEQSQQLLLDDDQQIRKANQSPSDQGGAWSILQNTFDEGSSHHRRMPADRDSPVINKKSPGTTSSACQTVVDQHTINHQPPNCSMSQLRSANPNGKQIQHLIIQQSPVCKQLSSSFIASGGLGNQSARVPSKSQSIHNHPQTTKRSSSKNQMHNSTKMGNQKQGQQQPRGKSQLNYHQQQQMQPEQTNSQSALNQTQILPKNINNNHQQLSQELVQQQLQWQNQKMSRLDQGPPATQQRTGASTDRNPVFSENVGYDQARLLEDQQQQQQSARALQRAYLSQTDPHLAAFQVKLVTGTAASSGTTTPFEQQQPIVHQAMVKKVKKKDLSSPNKTFSSSQQQLADSMANFAQTIKSPIPRNQIHHVHIAAPASPNTSQSQQQFLPTHSQTIQPQSSMTNQPQVLHQQSSLKMVSCASSSSGQVVLKDSTLYSIPTKQQIKNQLKDAPSSWSMTQTFNVNSKPTMKTVVQHSPSSKTPNHSQSTKQQQNKIKTFDQFDKAQQYVAVVPRMNQTSYQPMGTPKHLKKMSQMNSSMDQYLQRTSYATERVSSTAKSLDNAKHHHRVQKKQHSLSVFDASSETTANDEMVMTERDRNHHRRNRNLSVDETQTRENQQQKFEQHQALLRSLEVLEEQSNEENSPMIQRKKRLGGRQISSSPTNFIKADSRGSSLKQSKKHLMELNEITLTNQKVVPIVSMRSFNPETQDEDGVSLRIGGENVNELLFLSSQINQLQQQMNSGVFIGGAANSAVTSQAHNQQQHQAMNNNMNNGNYQAQPNAANWKHAAQNSHEYQNNQTVETTQAGSVVFVDQATYQQHQQHQQQLQLQQQQQHQQQNNNQMQGGGPTQFRVVPVQGSNGAQPPHLSQQAQQMLHSKLQIQQNAGQQMNMLRSSQQQKYSQFQVDPPAPAHTKAHTQKVLTQSSQQQQPQYIQGGGSKNARALASANKQNHQQMQQTPKQPSSSKYMMANMLGQQQLVIQQTTSPHHGQNIRPSSNHRVLVPIKQSQQQAHHMQQNQQNDAGVSQHQKIQQVNDQQPQQQVSITSTSDHQRQQAQDSQSINQHNTISSSSHQTTTISNAQQPGGQNNQSQPTAAEVNGDQPAQAQANKGRTYKEIRQRLQQQQQMQYLRQQQQQWIARQQQILLTNNPGASLEQVNAIIQQSILNQQQQMQQHTQQAQIQALQQVSETLQMQTQQAQQEAAQLQQQQREQQQQIFPNGSISSHQPSQQAQSNNQNVTSEDEQSTSGKQSTQQSAKTGKRQIAIVNQATAGNTGTGQQVQIKQNVNGQMSIGLTNASSQGVGALGQLNSATNSQNQTNQLPGAPSSTQHRNQITNNQQQLLSSVPTNPKQQSKDDSLMSYSQLLKQECQYQGDPSQIAINYKPNQNGQNLQPTNLPIENLKHSLQQLTSEILRKVLARSDSMNTLRQIIDLKAKKVKPKSYESSIFQTVMEKEQQRVTQESTGLSKNQLRIEDKTLIKYLRGQVKKMLKPFRGLQYDDFLNNEIHLNEIMATQDQQNDPIKESRKRHLRILEAALKEQVVDIQIVLGICVQISRQAFYNELQEYFICAYDYIMANQSSFQPHDIQGIVNLKKKLGSMRSHSKVQIHTTKKLDRMFWLLLEQNQEVRNNIRTYKERYIEKTENGGPLSVMQDGPSNNNNPNTSQNQGGGQANQNSASHLQRRQTHALRSSSGIGGHTASPKVQAGGSSHNVFNGANHKAGDGTVRRQMTKNSRGSNLKQEGYTNNSNNQNGANQSTFSKKNDLNHSSEVQDAVNLHATAGKQSQILGKMISKNQQLLPISGPNNSNNGKKAHSLIQKKMKAKDLDRQLNSQQATPAIGEKTPDHTAIQKKRMSSNKVLSAQHTTHTPQTFHPRSRTKVLNQVGVGSLAKESGHHGSTSNNSTENLFNLIQATKKNTALEPLNKSHKKNDSIHSRPPENPNEFADRDQIGSGLQARRSNGDNGVSISQKSHRMRQTDYSRGFLSNLEMDNATAEMDPSQIHKHGKVGVQVGNAGEPGSPSKVFRSWSRPQIISNDLPDMANTDINSENNGGATTSGGNFMLNGKVLKTMQMCTCAKFRKRIEPIIPGAHGINVATLDSNLGTDYKTSGKIDKTSSELNQSPDNHPARRLQNTEITGSIKSDFKGFHRKGEHSQDLANEENGTSPSKQGQPRMSQDFKMRILTRSKVAVPVSAASLQNRSQQSASSFENSHHKVAFQNNRQQLSSDDDINSVNNGSSIQDHAVEITAHKASMMQKSTKIVTYELCQECGGQRPAGLPQVKSSLSEVNVKLAVGQVPGYQRNNSNNDDEFPGTARLNDSGRSSTLSLGADDRRRRSSSSHHRRQHRSGQMTDNLLSSNDVNLGRILMMNSNKIGDKLNERYLMDLGIPYVPSMLQVIADSRARRIQVFYRERHEERVFAVKIIQHRWRVNRKTHEVNLFRRGKLESLRKKVAINRIYDFYRMITVRKVTVSAMLIQQQLWQDVQQSQDLHGDNYMNQIVLIQRKWRAILSRRYLVGKALVAKKQTRQKIWDGVMRNKYKKLQCMESGLQFQDTMFRREQRNLDIYFWKQQVNYVKDLQTRGAKIQQRLQQDYVQTDWTYDPIPREWHNSVTQMTLKLEKSESSSQTVLKEKLTKFMVSNQLPQEPTINRHLDDLQDARNATQKALKKEQDYKKRHLLQSLKRQRLANLFDVEPDFSVDQV